MRLLDICDFQGGSQPPKEEWSFAEQEGYIRMLQIRDFTQSEKVTPEYIKISNCIKTCTEDDVLIARYGASIGKVLTGIAGAYNVAIMRTIPDTDIIRKRFLYYYLKSSYFQYAILNVGSRAAQAGFNKTDLAKLEITCPELSKQDKIVKILEKVESIIQKRKDQLNALDYIIKARFVEMFGDVIHNDRKWECKQFSDITTSRLGKMLDAKHQIGTCKYPYLANFNVQWFRFELGNLNEMDFNEKDREEFCLEDGDLLVCEGGEIGRCAVWHNQVKKCYFQKALHRVRCNQNIILPDYLSWWFKYNCENGGFAAIEGAKATISHLTGAKMKMLDVTVPPIELQEQFVDFIKHVDKSKLLSLIKLLEQLITYLYNVFIIYRQDKGEEVEKYE
ncbi:MULTISPECIES: restriction endonuclease subunit S [Coprococcus]|uniref:restriction endonuclease subunit S n=1 Tax=Coprococcus TaxID=33042 RepID=UPI00156DE3D1|nr:restriction endonuclease subunit S [Coprococcus eutactus]NSE71936.1 restriction endonuclease subunit S [Coprococcus eutactus]